MNEAARAHALPLGQLIDRIFRLFWAHLRVFLGIAFPPMAVTLFLLLVAMGSVFIPIVSHLPDLPAVAVLTRTGILLFVLHLAVSLVIFGVFLAAGSYAAMQANLGETPTISGAFRAVRKRAGRYVLLVAQCYLVSLFPALMLELAMLAVGATMGSDRNLPGPAFFVFFALIMLLFPAALVYGIVIALRLSLAVPACVAEDLTARAAMRRSCQLTKGAMGRIFLALVVVYAVSYLATLVAEAMGFVGGALLLFAIGPSHLHALTPGLWAGAGILGLVLFIALSFCMALTWASMTTVLGVVYHDQRYHLEGVWPAEVASGSQHE